MDVKKIDIKFIDKDDKKIRRIKNILSPNKKKLIYENAKKRRRKIKRERKVRNNKKMLIVKKVNSLVISVYLRDMPLLFYRSDIRFCMNSLKKKRKITKKCK